MELNGTIFGSELAAAFIFLLLFGVLYNLGIEKFPWLRSRRSAEQVTVGVLVTLIASGAVIGWDCALKVLILFVASGTPMIIGSWIRAAKDDEEAKRIAKDVLR